MNRGHGVFSFSQLTQFVNDFRIKRNSFILKIVLLIILKPKVQKGKEMAI